MNNHADTLQEKLLKEVSERKEPVDIFPYITLNALDIICGELLIFYVVAQLPWPDPSQNKWDGALKNMAKVGYITLSFNC